MAWFSSGSSNRTLVSNLKANGVFSSSVVENAMLNVDRGHYIQDSPYQDSPQSLGFGVTISAPHMHAMCLELLANHLQPGMKALDVGSGSGYLTACMAHMCGQAYGIEYINELVPISIENLQRSETTRQMLTEGKIVIKSGDGWKGLPDHAPFNAIHVGAAAETLPQALVDQLAPGGRMVIPVGAQNDDQYLLQVDKRADGSVVQSIITGVRYVPLVNPSKSQ